MYTIPKWFRGPFKQSFQLNQICHRNHRVLLSHTLLCFSAVEMLSTQYTPWNMWRSSWNLNWMAVTLVIIGRTILKRIGSLVSGRNWWKIAFNDDRRTTLNACMCVSRCTVWMFGRLAMSMVRWIGGVAMTFIHPKSQHLNPKRPNHHKTYDINSLLLLSNRLLLVWSTIQTKSKIKSWIWPICAIVCVRDYTFIHLAWPRVFFFIHINVTRTVMYNFTHIWYEQSIVPLARSIFLCVRCGFQSTFICPCGVSSRLFSFVSNVESSFLIRVEYIEFDWKLGEKGNYK